MGNYHVVAELGRGGMGVVYKAQQQSLNRSVAIKVLPAHLSHDEGFVKRFLREARFAAELNHPNIVTIHDVGQHGAHYFIVMEYILGVPLSTLLRNGPLKELQALRVAYQIALALAAAHAHMIIHRDIKPENIMVDPEGRVKVTDFGLAKAITGASNLTATGALLGTPRYMSPEQCRAEEVNTRSDVYSLGVVLFEMLVGKAPFTADTPLVLMRQIVEDPFPAPSSLRPGIPEPIDRLVLKMVAKDPALRYISAEAVAKDIAACARSLGTGSSPSASAAASPIGFTPTPETAGSLSGVSESSHFESIPSSTPPAQAAPGARKGVPSKRISIGLAAVAALVSIVAGMGLWWSSWGPHGESGPVIIAQSDIPLGAGIKSTFRDADTGEALVFHTLSRTERKGHDYYTIDTPFANMYFTMRADALYEYLHLAEDTPAAVIQLPLTVGARWSATVTTDRMDPNKNKAKVYYYADAEEPIDTPRGVLAAVRVLYGNEEDLEESPTTNARWYAPELGLVRMRTFISDRWVRAELESFERGDPPRPRRALPTMIQRFTPSMASGLVIEATDLPMAVGTVTYMRTIGNPEWDVEFSQLEAIDKDGERFYAVRTPYGWTYHCKREDGLYEYLMFDQEDPEAFIPFPLAVGMKWSITAARGWRKDEVRSRYYVADAEEVLETEAGPIRALRVIMGEEPDLRYDPETTAARWYAKEKGLVKFNALLEGARKMFRWEFTSLRLPE